MFTVDQQISLWLFRHGEKKYFENISAFNLVPRSQTCKILRLRETDSRAKLVLGATTKLI